MKFTEIWYPSAPHAYERKRNNGYTYIRISANKNQVGQSLFQYLVVKEGLFKEGMRQHSENDIYENRL